MEAFARDVLLRPLDPWQRWLAIHGLELLPNGWPRFRQVLVLVARQNGKTELLVILSLFWLWVQQVPMVLGTSTKLDYARISWKKAIQLARATPELRVNMRVRRENGKEELAAVLDPVNEIESMYKIAASNEEGGRSLTIDRLVEDELRQHHDYSAHEAAENAMNAVDDAQAWAITNEGDDRAVVLHDLYDAALEFITTGAGDERLGLFAWSARPGCDLLDVEETAQANPNLGRRIQWANLVGKAQRAKLLGGEAEAKHRTEVLCQRVARLKAERLSLDAWAETARVVPSDQLKDPVFFLTIAKELRSASIAVAARIDGRPHVELADHRAGTAWLADCVQELHERYPNAPFSAYHAGPARSWVPAFAQLGLELQMMPAQDTMAAYGHLKKLADDLAFTHSPNQVVVDSLKGADWREVDGGGWVLDWHRSIGDPAPIAATAGALWLLESADQQSDPGVYWV